jgi:hypothetical protein
LHFLQEIPGGKKTKFEKHKKWVGKGNKWLEKPNILGWEKLLAWRVEVRGAPNLAAPLITDQLRHNPRILYPVRWLGFVVPTLSAMKLRKGWGTQICGPSKISKTQGAPPAQNGFWISAKSPVRSATAIR